MAGLTFAVAGEEEPLNLESTLNLLTDTDRARREAAARALAEVFRPQHQALRPGPQHAGQGKGDHDRWRKMPTPQTGATCRTMWNPRWSRRCAMRWSPPIRN
jgi:oligoendopeptidase F